MLTRFKLLRVRMFYYGLILLTSARYRVVLIVLTTRHYSRVLVARALFSLLRLVLQVEKPH